MAERDTLILAAVVGVNLLLLSALLVVRLRASGQEALAPRVIAEMWLTFALAFVLFRSMRQMLGGWDLGSHGVVAGLSETGRHFAALGPAAKAWFVGGGLVAVGLLIHLIVSIGRACGAPLKRDAEK